MNSFREQLKRDIFAAFLNTDEFAEYGELAGHEEIPMLVARRDMAFPDSAPDDRPDVNYEGVTVHVAFSDVPERLLAGRAISFNHEQWFVGQVTDTADMRQIELYREQA